MKIILAILATLLFLAICSTSVVAQTIRATSLSELIGSDNEIECFAFKFDTKPKLVKESLDSFRHVYKKMILTNEWQVSVSKDSLIYARVPLDTNGNIVSYKVFKKHMKVDNSTKEKTLFHYED